LHEIAIDRFVLLFTLGLSFVTALLCGLAPAVKTSALDLNDALKEGGRTSAPDFAADDFEVCS
jgi:hypothetical protein